LAGRGLNNPRKDRLRFRLKLRKEQIENEIKIEGMERMRLRPRSRGEFGNS
jgi:hypothetical protein